MRSGPLRSFITLRNPCAERDPEKPHVTLDPAHGTGGFCFRFSRGVGRQHRAHDRFGDGVS